MRTRRNFLKVLTALGAMVSCPFLGCKKRDASATAPAMQASGSTAESSATPDSSTFVCIESCATYAPEAVYQAVKKALRTIDFTFGQYRRVLLKPNVIAQNTPQQAATTHPAVVEAVCRLCIESGCTVSIGDSSAFYQNGITRRGFETTGIAAVARKYGATLLPFEATSLREITTGQALNPFYITEAVFQHDLVVNLPKLKVHRLTYYSGAIKNIYGCVVGGTKQLYHMRFQKRPDYKQYWGKPLVDVYQAVNPGLTIMDAIVGLDKDGPAANGEPRPTGLLLAARSGPALDVVACRIIDFDPLWVPAVAAAVERGLVDPRRIRVSGPQPRIPYVKLTNAKPQTGVRKKFDDFSFQHMLVTPHASRLHCRKCRTCIDKCATAAIRVGHQGFPAIDYGKCIYCYCCGEYCPNHAIHFHGGPLNGFIRVMRRIIKI